MEISFDRWSGSTFEFQQYSSYEHAARLPRYNWPGLAAYGLGTVAAFGSPWVAPLVGIGVAALGYGVFNGLSRGRRAAAPASL
ncbi:hypothetical protein BJP27_22900 [Pseudomonas oryzihabitans]|nr:hypothetical protein BJP27_22900 [Pseudomonas psychrotolerans]